MAYIAEQYQLEKATGLRRPSGQLKLSKLRAKHFCVIDLHMLGRSGREIAAELGYSEAWVSNVLTDPLSVAEIQRRVDEARATLNPIYTKAIRRVDEGLDATYKDGETPNHTTRLRAADMVFKVKGEYDKAGDSEKTAEDVVAQIINLQVNVGTQPSLPPPVNGEVDGHDNSQ